MLRSALGSVKPDTTPVVEVLQILVELGWVEILHVMLF